MGAMKRWWWREGVLFLVPLLLKYAHCGAAAQAQPFSRSPQDIRIVETSKDGDNERSDTPWVFVITPSKKTASRAAELTRTAQSLAHVQNLKWIVVEDGAELDPAVYEMLERKREKLKLDSVYLSVQGPQSPCRGNPQRDAGLQWILDRIWPYNEHTLRKESRHDIDFLREEAKASAGSGSSIFGSLFSGPAEDASPYLPDAPEYRKIGRDYDPAERFNPDYVFTAPRTRYTRFMGKYNDHFQDQKDWPLISQSAAHADITRPLLKGVIYFADDDNTYDSDLFDEVRYTSRVSLFPVGLVTNTALSTPIVNATTGAVLGFYDGWIADRTWPLDTAGFAISTEYMFDLHPERDHWFFPLCGVRGHCEVNWLVRAGLPAQVVPEGFVANQATRVLAWHTKSRSMNYGVPIAQELQRETNLEVLARRPEVSQTVTSLSERDPRKRLPIALIARSGRSDGVAHDVPSTSGDSKEKRAESAPSTTTTTTTAAPFARR